MIRRNYGIAFCVLLFFWGAWGANRWLGILYGETPSYFEVSGFASIWSCMFMVFFGGIMGVALTIKKTDWVDKHIHWFLIVIAFALSPIMAGGVFYGLKSKASEFTECKELRRSSRLHSSRTYAITPQECQRLVSDRQAREL
ncbi:MAG: hypothetical protein ACRDA8_09100 [Shewanella sp.]